LVVKDKTVGLVISILITFAVIGFLLIESVISIADHIDLAKRSNKVIGTVIESSYDSKERVYDRDT
jgi:hypothetical protein